MTDQFFGWSGVMLVAAVLACGTSNSGNTGPTAPAATSAADWRPLFDGKSTAGWRGYHQKTAPAGWQAVNGALTRVSGGGDLITVDQFDSFELELEWQIAEGGNSGIMYRVSEEGEEAYYSGPEFQVLDNGRHADGKNPLTSAGSAYGLYAPVKDVTRPIGEWNAARIVHQGESRRALAERHQGGRVRTGQRRLATARRRQQVQGVAHLRPGAEGAHRAPGSRQPGRLPQHPDPVVRIRSRFLHQSG